MHPWAWWCWAIGIGLAVSGTTNPLLLALIATAMVAVVMLRRSNAPWARSVKAYLLLSLFVIGMRVFFQVLIGSGSGETVLFALPEIPLPEWAAGIRLGGPVTAEGLVHTLYDALRLAVMLLCIGAANALANPRRALRSVPAALYEASVAVVVALSVAPQLIESAQRVHRARRLRGQTAKGLGALSTVAMPVLSDAIERSIALAAGMESRGFARTRGLPVRGSLPVMLSAVLVSLLGVFLLLSTSWWLLAVGLLLVGLAGTAWGLRRAGRALRVTAHRPDPWGARETLVAATGIGAAVLLLGLGWLDPGAAYGALHPSTDPLQWPELTAPMLAVVGLVLAPLAITRTGGLRTVTSLRNDTRVRSLRPQVEPELVPR
ncbi:MAG: energy-coupling factor transporter transmembrane protein EcfT [Propionibacteriaceae bacterium]|nr:energy-coupling factor transporter transmembrane protein EcfT [Propionibacteriaceae bacterium]